MPYTVRQAAAVLPLVRAAIHATMVLGPRPVQTVVFHANPTVLVVLLMANAVPVHVGGLAEIWIVPGNRMMYFVQRFLVVRQTALISVWGRSGDSYQPFLVSA